MVVCVLGTPTGGGETGSPPPRPAATSTLAEIFGGGRIGTFSLPPHIDEEFFGGRGAGPLLHIAGGYFGGGGTGPPPHILEDFSPFPEV